MNNAEGMTTKPTSEMTTDELLIELQGLSTSEPIILYIKLMGNEVDCWAIINNAFVDSGFCQTHHDALALLLLRVRQHSEGK